MKWNEVTRCDYCGEIPPLKLKTEHTLFGRPIYFSKCLCGLYQMSPHPDPEEYYELFMEGTIGGKAYQMLQIEKFSVPEEIFVPSGKLWDVGCGVGKILERAKLFGMRAAGNDINLSNVKYARTQGYIVALLPTVHCHPYPNDYDVVTMKSYLSHSFTPYSDLLGAYEALNNGGILFIRTSTLKNIRSHELEVDHMSYYTRNCLLDMIRDAGFEVESVKEHKPLRRDLYEAKLDIIARKES